MNIWIIDHYSVPVKYYPLARNTNFAKNLIKMGHEVTIFAASTVHNSKINLIEDGSKYKEMIDDGVKYVIVNCHQYSGNGLKRILNMYEFARRLETVCGGYKRPDAIVSTSMTLPACKKGIQIAKKYGCKKVAQITDLWPETLIAYGAAAKRHPLVLWFRKTEKWIYKNADRIIFSMEGAYDYIKEQGWEKEVQINKVAYINNGIDLEQFDYNSERYQITDEDLCNDSFYKVIYIGSIRKVNNLTLLVDTAKQVKNPNVRFLIWGDGDDCEKLKERVIREKIDNVKFKGRVDKKYIPYITKNADLNIAHGQNSPILRFGISMNKIFDYMAAAKPILVDFDCPYNPIIKCNAGIESRDSTASGIANAVDDIANMDEAYKKKICDNARHGAEQYDFKRLTSKLEKVIESI